MFIGIDQSKRSTAAVMLNPDGSMKDFTLICLADEDEELILKQWKDFDYWLQRNLFRGGKVTGALIEGLSFGSVGSGKDFLAGLQWYFRARFKEEYGLFLGTTPVSQWRSKVLTKEEQREAKAQGKDGLKKACVAKLPADVKDRFSEYLEQHKDEINAVKVKDWKPGSKSKVYLDSMYDLSDAHHICSYRLSLEQ